MDFLLNWKWNNQKDITLHMFLTKHRLSFHSLNQCGDHMAVDILSERTRVGNLIENIEFNDKDVSAALSYFHLDYNVNRIRNESKKAVYLLLPTDPVNNKKKRGHTQIYYVSTPRTAGKGKGREKGK